MYFNDRIINQIKFALNNEELDVQQIKYYGKLTPDEWVNNIKLNNFLDNFPSKYFSS